MSITSPLKTITDPLKEIKMVKTDPKKLGSKPNFLFARSSRYNCPTFYEKNVNPFKCCVLYGFHENDSLIQCNKARRNRAEGKSAYI